MNTFGGPRSYQQFGLIDPRSIRQNRQRFRRDAIKLLERANSFYCCAGRYPSRGWILMVRSEYDQLDRYATDLELHIGDTSARDNASEIRNLSIVQAQCLTRGLASDPNAIYLVELTDGRGILENEWFKFPVSTSYNIRAPAYPDTFHPASMNDGVPVTTTWTWSTMLQDLWERMGTFLGAWPGLPSTPPGTPEGFWLQGVPAFSALCDILDHLGMVIVVDHTLDNPYSIVGDGDTDATLTTLQSRYLNRLEDDLEWIDVGAGRVPGTIRVMFRKRYEVYGTEETVRRDGAQWDMTPLYSIDVSAPSRFTGAVGTHYIQSDFTIRADDNGQPLAVDTAIADQIAQGLATQYYNKIYSGALGSMLQTYTGALPFTTGSQVDVVRFYQDYSNNIWQGWKTQISRELSLQQLGL